MNGDGLVALFAGVGVGTGLLCILLALTGDSAAHRHGVRVARLRRVIAGVTAALLVAVITRWVAVAVAAGVLVFVYDRVFGGTKRNRLAIARLEALAAWTESLRDLIATGLALPEALPATVAAANPLIRPQLTALAERLSAREPLEASLQGFADEVGDAGADLVVAALLLNSRAQGRALHTVLSSLARSARSELAVRRSVEAERRSTRRAVQFVVAVTVVTALGLAVLNPTYVAPYRSVAGQLVLAVVVGIFALGFTWLSRLSALPAPDRFLAAREVTR